MCKNSSSIQNMRVISGLDHNLHVETLLNIHTVLLHYQTEAGEEVSGCFSI